MEKRNGASTSKAIVHPINRNVIQGLLIFCLPNVEVTGEPLEPACGAGMFVIKLRLDSPERAALWIVRWTVLLGRSTPRGYKH